MSSQDLTQGLSSWVSTQDFDQGLTDRIQVLNPFWSLCEAHTMSSDCFQYRALFEYNQERGDDISLQSGDLLTVAKTSLLTPDYQEGDEKCPKGWLRGTNERTQEKGNFPGTFVEYVGVVRAGHPSGKPWPRPVPPTPVGPQAPGATASEGECHNLCFILHVSVIYL